MVEEAMKQLEEQNNQKLEAQRRSEEEIRKRKSTERVLKEETERWIASMAEVGVETLASYTPNEIPKVDICRALNIGLIIDDNKAICDRCIDNGVRALNFIGDEDSIYPWCEESDISIQGWMDVRQRS